MEIKKEKLNSFAFRWGGTSTDVKLYFEDAQDLARQLKDFENHAEKFRASIENTKTKMNA